MRVHLGFKFLAICLLVLMSLASFEQVSAFPKSKDDHQLHDQYSLDRNEIERIDFANKADVISEDDRNKRSALGLANLYKQVTVPNQSRGSSLVRRTSADQQARGPNAGQTSSRNIVARRTSPDVQTRGPNAGQLSDSNSSLSKSTAKCNCNCPLNDGVCGRAQDGSLHYFPSKCSMECYDCTHNQRFTLYRRGACPESTTTSRSRPTLKPIVSPPTTARRPSPTPQCKCGCPRGTVICARDKYGNKQTFGSECMLNCYNCTANADFRKIKEGDC